MSTYSHNVTVSISYVEDGYLSLASELQSVLYKSVSLRKFALDNVDRRTFLEV